MSWKHFQAYLSFSRRDRIGILGLLVLIGLAWLLPRFFPEKTFAGPEPLRLDRPANDSAREASMEPEYFPELSLPGKTARLFAFDPNTLDAGGWEKLGLPPRCVRTILNYRQKGGKFRQPEDLKKIWGLPQGFYERVRDYIRIPAAAANTVREFRAAPERVPPAPVELNSADSAGLVKLPGIGPRLAARIISFREKLGGFHDISQLAEVYGLPDSTFRKLQGRITVTGDVRQLNINMASKEELQAHPYISRQLAGVITEFRKQHGIFRDQEALRKIHLVSDSLFNRIRPYLRVTE